MKKQHAERKLSGTKIEVKPKEEPNDEVNYSLFMFKSTSKFRIKIKATMEHPRS